MPTFVGTWRGVFDTRCNGFHGPSGQPSQSLMSPIRPGPAGHGGFLEGGVLNVKIRAGSPKQPYVKPKLLVGYGCPCPPHQVEIAPLRSTESAIDSKPFIVPQGIHDGSDGRGPLVPITAEFHVRPMWFKESFSWGPGERQDFDNLNAKHENSFNGPVGRKSGIQTVTLLEVLFEANSHDGMINPGGRSLGVTSVSPRDCVPARIRTNTIGRVRNIHVIVPHGQELVTDMGKITGDEFLSNLVVADMTIHGNNGAVPYSWQPEANSGQPPLMLAFGELKDFHSMHMLFPKNCDPGADAPDLGANGLGEVRSPPQLFENQLSYGDPIKSDLGFLKKENIDMFKFSSFQSRQTTSPSRNVGTGDAERFVMATWALTRKTQSIVEQVPSPKAVVTHMRVSMMAIALLAGPIAVLLKVHQHVVPGSNVNLGMQRRTETMMGHAAGQVRNINHMKTRSEKQTQNMKASVPHSFTSQFFA